MPFEACTSETLLCDNVEMTHLRQVNGIRDTDCREGILELVDCVSISELEFLVNRAASLLTRLDEIRVHFVTASSLVSSAQSSA